MVSKATATKGSAQAIDYLLDDKGKAVELDRYGIAGQNGTEILAEFREIQALNTRCQNNTYSIVLSPSNEKEFSLEELQEIGIEHLQNLGLTDRQYLMTAHLSTDQPHIHIQVNRIDFFGKAHNDHIIGLKSQESAEKIAKRLGLTTARQVEKEKMDRTEALRKELSELNKKVLLQVQTFSQYCALMDSFGVEIKPTIRNNGELQGYHFFDKKSGETLKASKVTGAGLKRLIEKGVEIDHKTTQIYDDFKQEMENTQKMQNRKKTIQEDILWVESDIDKIRKEKELIEKEFEEQKKQFKMKR